MAGSIKDALRKSGRVAVDESHPKPKKRPGGWREELPEPDSAPYIPFDAPALTKVKDPRQKKK